MLAGREGYMHVVGDSRKDFCFFWGYAGTEDPEGRLPRAGGAEEEKVSVAPYEEGCAPWRMSACG